MRRVAVGLVIGSLMLGGMSLPAEARSRHHGRYRQQRHVRQHRPERHVRARRPERHVRQDRPQRHVRRHRPQRHIRHYGHRTHVRHHGHRTYVRHHRHHNGHGHFFGGFVAGAATFLVLDALTTPRVVYAPPVVAPVCRNVWVAERWEVQAREQDGFTTYYQVLVPGTWQRQCY